ncbi:hypothetical protein PR202_ga06989 [Eleusine coracana subsp. coracana]|uniref:Uncharacterized protein n=1 Tax=Eleusine coracana subsp. coracana TaxID=191504 RepID=A0AAV5BXD0_ELECO|nr:hypothetical protein PR202_ga06989 [Eleusine coracana subsp. coracana]
MSARHDHDWARASSYFLLKSPPLPTLSSFHCNLFSVSFISKLELSNCLPSSQGWRARGFIRTYYYAAMATHTHGGCILLAAVLLLVAVLPPPPAEALPVCGGSNGSTSTYTAGSAYETNLNRVIDALPTNASSSPSFFATATVGTVYAIGLCRLDLAASSCLVCLQSALSDAKVACPFSMDASTDMDGCHTRFSDLDFLASKANSVQRAFFSVSYPVVAASVAGRFNGLVARLLDATAAYAATTSQTRFFATGVMVVDKDDESLLPSSIFATAQCTPDLTPAQCRACLDGAMAEVPRQVFPRNSSGGSFAGERCGLRFATYSFYTATPWCGYMLRHLNKEKRGRALVLIIVFAILAGLLALTLIGLLVWKKKRSQRKAPFFMNVEDMECFESIFIGLSTLRSATNNFDEKNKLGEGGFGSVYKGTLPDGQEVAVKRLFQSTKQGLGQMANELALLVKLKHKNLVRIIGVCLEDGEHMLVYEYMPNKSLDTIIFGTCPPLISYTELGYMSPEYALRGHYTTKLDVFSFGVLVLEIVTGRRNNYAVNSEDLFSLVWKHWVEGTIAEIADTGLGRHYPRGEVLKCINIGLLCVQQNPMDRPSMSAIAVMLGSDTVSLEAPYRPAYVLDRSRSYTEITELVKEPPCSEPHSSITELHPR